MHQYAAHTAACIVVHMTRSEFTSIEQATAHFAAMTIPALKAEAKQRNITVWGNKAMHVQQLVQWTIGRHLDSRAIAG